VTFFSACLTASCRDCGGIKATAAEPQGDNSLVQSWIARGDIVGAEAISCLRSENWRCICSSEHPKGER
jgi:hypothetical protein